MGLPANYRSVVGALLGAYFFISSIILIKESAMMMGKSLAEKVLTLIKDTTSGVFAGWITTAILHSSGAFDSIIVAFVSSGILPLSLAVATIIGAELGTTVTPLLVAVVGYAKNKVQLNARVQPFCVIDFLFCRAFLRPVHEDSPRGKFYLRQSRMAELRYLVAGRDHTVDPIAAPEYSRRISLVSDGALLVVSLWWWSAT